MLDTDVCSFLFRQDSRAEAYRSHLEGRILALSFMSVAELYQWAYLHNWGETRLARLEKWLRHFVILPFDNELCRWWAQVRVERQRRGHPISAQDAWIAACALRYKCALITHNAADYAGIPGLTVISEPTAPN